MVIPPAWRIGPPTLFTRIEESFWLRKRPRILLEAVIVSDIDWTKRQDKKERMGKNMSCWPSVRRFHTVVVPYYL
jgi:hypothetical protein